MQLLRAETDSYVLPGGETMSDEMVARVLTQHLSMVAHHLEDGRTGGENARAGELIGCWDWSVDRLDTGVLPANSLSGQKPMDSKE